jgi:transcription elongation factor GreA
MTPRGYAALQEELQRLKAMRPELALAIETARAHGDLSENADYDAAKERSAMFEGKIRDIEVRLTQAEVIDPRRLSSLEKVVFGVTVTIEEVESGEQKTYSIYGSEESDITRGWISYETPLAKGLMGRSEGQTVTVRLPGGTKEFEIVSIVVDYSDA